MTVERYEKSQSLIIKKGFGLGSHLLNFISADGVVRFHYPNKYGESIVRQVIFQEYWKRVIAFSY
jgi:hypothetical protein